MTLKKYNMNAWHAGHAYHIKIITTIYYRIYVVECINIYQQRKTYLKQNIKYIEILASCIYTYIYNEHILN